jgi:hypothetical protein
MTVLPPADEAVVRVSELFVMAISGSVNLRKECSREIVQVLFEMEKNVRLVRFNGPWKLEKLKRGHQCNE